MDVIYQAHIFKRREAGGRGGGGLCNLRSHEPGGASTGRQECSTRSKIHVVAGSQHIHNLSHKIVCNSGCPWRKLVNCC